MKESSTDERAKEQATQDRQKHRKNSKTVSRFKQNRQKELERKILKRGNKEIINPAATKLDVGLVRCEINKGETNEEIARGDERVFFSVAINQDFFVSEKTDLDMLVSWTERFAFTL